MVRPQQESVIISSGSLDGTGFFIWFASFKKMREQKRLHTPVVISRSRGIFHCCCHRLQLPTRTVPGFQMAQRYLSIIPDIIHKTWCFIMFISLPHLCLFSVLLGWNDYFVFCFMLCVHICCTPLSMCPYEETLLLIDVHHCSMN